MRDHASWSSFVPALPLVAAPRTTGTVNGTTVDTMSVNGGNNALTFIILAGVITDGSHVFSLADSPDNSVWTPVPANLLVAPASLTWTSANAAGSLLKIGYLGINRYVRLVDTITGTTTGGIYTSIAQLSYPVNLPAA